MEELIKDAVAAWMAGGDVSGIIITSIELQFHSQRTMQKIARYECELECDYLT